MLELPFSDDAEADAAPKPDRGSYGQLNACVGGGGTDGGAPARTIILVPRR